jgi:hypothetical protein
MPLWARILIIALATIAFGLTIWTTIAGMMA